MAARHFKPKACAWCGTEFTPTAPRATYCTPECFKAKNRERMRKYRDTNKDAAREYYAANKERILENAREYRQTNKERLNTNHRKYYQDNTERLAEYYAAYRQANKQKIRDRKRKYYHANKEAIAEATRRYREANKERLRDHRRKYEEANREHIRERCRAWRDANKEVVNESIRRWRANNPEKVGAAAARRAKAELEGNATPKLIETKWEAGDKTCILCGEPIDPTLKAPHNMSRTIEHLTPIARGGHHDIDNIDFAHYGCNAQKQDRTLEEYREWRERVA